MEKYNKVYKVISIVNFALTVITFVTALVASFLPYRNGVMFFDGDAGFYMVLVPFFISGILSFFAIKFPLVSIPVPILSLLGSVFALGSYLGELIFAGLSNPWIGTEMSSYGIGFKLLSSLSWILIIQVPFVLYAIVTFVVRLVDNNTKTNSQENKASQ